MSIKKYEYLHNKFHNTIPIRGRAVEVRPIGERRRDWEQIVRVLTPQGEGYGARLYNTDCVVVAPNGDMYIQIDGWATPLTAEWISRYSGLRCYKKYSKIWIEVDGRTIPVDKNEKLHLKFKNNDFVNVERQFQYSCDKVVIRKQKVIDKDKIKAVRHSVKEFKTFVKAMMTLADGWVSDELLKAHRTTSEGYYGWRYEFNGEQYNQWDLRSDRMSQATAQGLLKHMQSATDPQDMVKLMLMVTESVSNIERRLVRTETKTVKWGDQEREVEEHIYEYRYDPKSVVNRIDYIIKKADEVFTEKEVVVDKPMTNLL